MKARARIHALFALVLVACGGADARSANAHKKPPAPPPPPPAPVPVPPPPPAPAPAPGTPAWQAGQGVNEWREIPGSAMSLFPPSVDPGRQQGTGPSAKMDAWSGGAVDTRSSRVWWFAAGGHDDYHGNEIDMLDLEADQPRWIEALRSNSAAEFTLPNNDGYYSSGRPASAHTYYQQQFIESMNRAVRFGVGSAANSGNAFGDVDGFEVASGTLDPRHTFPALPAATPGMTTAKDPATEDVYLFRSNYAVYKWTRATNAWSQVNSGWPPISALESAAAFDPVRGRIFLLKGAESAVCHTFDPATGLFTARTLTGDVAAVNAASKGIGMLYEADRFLVRLPDAGGAVYAIDPATFVVSALPTSGGEGVPAVFSTSVYQRWLPVPLRGGVVYFPRYSANAWFFKTR